MDNVLFHTDQIYNAIVREINRLIDEQVILINEQGVIVASTNSDRIGSFHEGSYLAMKNKEKMIMTDDDVKRLRGVRPGVVLPIIIEDKPMGVLGITGEPSVVEPYAMLVQKVTELFIHDSVARINQESKTRDLEFFIFDWLNHTGDFSQLLERSDFLHIDMFSYDQVVVFKCDYLKINLTYNQLEMVKKLWSSTINALFIRWGQEKIVMLLEAVEKDRLTEKLLSFITHIKKEMDIQLYAGVGNKNDSKRLSYSFQQANKSSEYANSKHPVVFEADLRFEMLTHELSAETKDQFVLRSIGALIQEEELMQTLSSWFENNMAVQLTADKLHIHKNTLHYRLNRIADVTKLNVRNVDDLMLLYISHRFYNEKRKT
ncbi:helix-turn-helix domain-containing protein [Virgibacillus sp. AGTR]|uniref:CdaR family transcriptional regulator n=1 Tax=Virgibacillus sp. AGTR TaxID=2812055 RepID=UPI00196631A0|nr:sugar diacid recognition domain-containing protein [Virgibacillus sp. AGTR]MCC2251089.1 helix-turn-helix domain-containing protein [Virgibacillus sp. AGTR]QRZ19908.1 helix-turn-helix domain-containing protein [Virgibacillus sp. AGTR]